MRRRWREGGRFFGAVVESGAHRASIGLVAGGEADIAAIDMVSWRYGQRFLPEAAGLRVLMLTDPTPGLPYIAALGTDVSRHGRAVASAIAGLAPEVGEALGLVGFAALDPGEYALIARRMAAAEGLVA